MQVLQHTHSPVALWTQGRLCRARSARLVPRAASGGQQNGSNNERNNYNVRKGKQFENSRRRRGRPAHLRSPYDSPLRDGNRDRLIGLLTERAAKTLMVYLMETNANVYSWLVEFYKKNPIPKNGSWDEVSGEAFLRKLLSMPIEEAKFNTGRDSLFDNVSSCGVDPRSIAQRIMDIRTQLSEEFIQELQAIAEENSLLLRETLATSLSTSLDDPPAAASSKDGTPVHPELADSPPSTTASSSSKDGSSSTGASKGSSSGSSGGGAVSTPPPSPTPAAPKRTQEPIKGSASSSSSSSSKKDAADAADKAAAVAALNAALSKPPVAGAGSTTSSSSSSEEKVDMADVLAQLRRAMEADVARDVMKMKESTTSSSAASSSTTTGSSDTGEESGPAATPVPATEAAAAPEAPSTDSLSPEQPPAPAPVPAAEAPDAPAPVAAAEPVAAAADSSSTPEAVAAAAASQDEDSSSISTTVTTQLSSSAVGEAGTYSRMLPKGWGPRLGVGFSRYPRSRNNIVSSANLGALKPPGAAGDAAVSGSTAASEAV